MSDVFPSPETGRVLVFDSGVGGLTVADEIAQLAPGLTIDYAADTGFFPYGDKSDEDLRARVPAAAKALCAVAQPDVFVIACNTASTLALAETRAALGIPVVGTVPAIKPAAANSQTGVIGLLATPGTLARDYTARLVAEFASETRIIPYGSVDLVRLAEDVAAGAEPDLDRIGTIQSFLFDAPGGERIDTIVLACTHFPLIRDALGKTAPRTVTYIDSGAAIARQTLRVLNQHSANTAAASSYATSAEPSDAVLSKAVRLRGYSPPRRVDVSG